MDCDSGDLRAYPEASLLKCAKEKLCSGESYQCASSFLVNEKIMKVSFDGQRIWAEQPENTDKLSEILRGLAFEITFAGDVNETPQGQPTGFVLYRLSKRNKITFRCLQNDPVRLKRWFRIFRAMPIPEIGLSRFYRFAEPSSDNATYNKIIRISDGKVFCAKCIRGSKFDENSRMTKEVQISNKFPGPNVMKVEGYFLLRRHSVLITEWIPDSLSDYLPPKNPDKTLTLLEFKYLIFLIVTVLADMHKQNIGHFAILKEHILVREDKTPVLIGFQQARTSDYAALIKKNHAAPARRGHSAANEDEDYEECDLRVNLPLEADVFTLGLIIYEYFTGRQPFNKTIIFEEAKVENVILWEELENSENVSPAALNILRRMLHRDRIKRAHFGNLKPHLFFEEFTKDEKKKRRKREPRPPKQEKDKKKRGKKTSNQTEASKREEEEKEEIFDQYEGRKKKSSSNSNSNRARSDKTRPILKRLKNGRFISMNALPAEGQRDQPYSVYRNASLGEYAHQEESNAFFIPGSVKRDLDGENTQHKEYEGMESEEVDEGFSYIESAVDEFNRLHEVESMEDQGASIWGEDSIIEQEL